MLFRSERADNFLHQKARQLPKDAPGIILIEVTSAPGAMKGWRSLIERRLHPGQHTRVGGVCLMFAGVSTSPKGPKWGVETQLVLNKHAKLRLPDWMVESLRRWESPLGG